MWALHYARILAPRLHFRFQAAGFLRGAAGGFNAEVTRDGAVVAYNSGYDAPIWARLTANWSSNTGAESQPLYVEGSLLYGQTSNEVSRIGTNTDLFNTERWLATLGVSGAIERQNFTLIPFLDAKYTEDA